MGSAKVMVVEDEFVVASDIEGALEASGFSVGSTVASGEEAVRRADAERPDLVLMDIVLQGEMDGIQAAEQIRSRFNIPVVFLTSYADEDVLPRARAASPFGYLVKPFEDRELRATIQMALDKAELEMKLRESQERWRSLVENAPAFVISVNREEKIQFINRGVPGLTAKEAIGQSVYKFIEPGYRNVAR